jgi:hypothetical protein
MPTHARLAGLVGVAVRCVRVTKDALDVRALLREVDEARKAEGPASLVARMRARGLQREPRTPEERRRLARTIAILDRVLMRSPNCYRRALVRLAMDRQSAAEPLVLGLDVQGGSPSGHAWIEGAEAPAKDYDVEFRL